MAENRSAGTDDFVALRPLLFSIAYRMTGSVGDAEDGGGKTQAIGKPLAGRQSVMRMLVSLLRRARVLGASLRLAWVNGQPGAVLYDAEGRVVSVIELDTGPNGHGSDVVQTMHAVVNPDKLAHLGPVSDVARLAESRPSPGGRGADGGA